MFTIGQFAQLAQVSVRTLRHYDDRGLLRPASVDRWSGHRHYAADQMKDLNRILALKDLGFTLTEIAKLLTEAVHPDELRGMLRLREHEAVRAAESEQKRLARVRASIDLLSEEPTVDELGGQVVVKPLRACRLAVVHGVIEDFDDDLPGLLQRLFGEVFGAIEAEGVEPTGPYWAWYAERDDDRIDVAAGAPVADGAVVPGLEIVGLAAVEKAATCVHIGQLSADCQGYRSLQTWLGVTGEQPVGLSREVYLHCEGNPTSWITELQFVLDLRETP